MDKVSLEDFVAETLRSISAGVHKAREATKVANTPPIAPFAVDGVMTSDGQQLIDFQVSIEVSRDKETTISGDAKGTVVSVVTGSVSGDRSSTHTDRTTQHIKFSVPIYFNAGWSQINEGSK